VVVLVLASQQGTCSNFITATAGWLTASAAFQQLGDACISSMMALREY
jgi:hypothetical protein